MSQFRSVACSATLSDVEDNGRPEMTRFLACLSFSSKSAYTAETTACRNGTLRADCLLTMFAYDCGWSFLTNASEQFVGRLVASELDKIDGSLETKPSVWLVCTPIWSSSFTVCDCCDCCNWFCKHFDCCCYCLRRRLALTTINLPFNFPSDRFSAEVDRDISRSSTDRARLTVERVERLVPEKGWDIVTVIVSTEQAETRR